MNGYCNAAAHFDQMILAHHLEFRTQMEEMLRAFSQAVESDPQKVSRPSRIHRFLAFHIFAYMKFFDEARTDDDPDNYYMEREWRVLGNVQFSLDDVSRVILPEEFAKRFRQNVPGYYKQLTFI